MVSEMGRSRVGVNEQGAIFIGIEIIPELVSVGLAEGFDVHFSDLATRTLLVANSLDIVVAIDVLEHIEISVLRNLLIAELRGSELKVCFSRGHQAIVHLLVRYSTETSTHRLFWARGQSSSWLTKWGFK